MATDGAYTSATPIKNGLLNSDGSITTFSGSVVAVANEKGAEIYKNMSVNANKFLNPDGSIKTLDEIIIDPSVGTLDTNNATAQTVPETPESFGSAIDLHKISKTGSFADLLSTPTTLSGYGITDGATTTYADGKVEDSITDGHTTVAPSGNAVYDALALKLDKTSAGTTRRVYGVDATDVQELTEIETSPTDSSTKLVTSGGIKSALDLKVDKVTGKGLSTEDYTTAEKTKLSGIEAEANKTVVTQETGTSTTSVISQNTVTESLALKLDKTSSGDLRRVYGVNASNAQELTEIETTPTSSSTKLVTSGGTKSALDLKAPLASPAFTGIPTGILQTFTATLPYASWTGSSAPYTKAVTVTGILSTDKPSIDLDLSSAAYSNVSTIQSSWANVYRAVTSADTITFYASTVPTIDIPLGIKVVR